MYAPKDSATSKENIVREGVEKERNMILHGYIIKIMKKNKDQAVSDSDLK